MSESPATAIEILDPVDVELDKDAVCIAYLNEEGDVLHAGDVEDRENSTVIQAEADFQEVNKSLRSKFHSGSKQSHEELNSGALTIGLNTIDIINPPYPPRCLANFLEVDPVFFRAVKAKVLDSVGREILIKPTLPIDPDFDGNATVEADTNSKLPPTAISSEQYRTDKLKIDRFIVTCNDVIGFRGVLERAAMDFEAIGWAGIEVIRSKDGRVRKIEHVPAQRLRVLKGFAGFAEVTNTTSDAPNSKSQYKYYQLFGEKFKVKGEIGDDLEVYDPDIHGPLENVELVENFRKFEDGKPTGDFSQSANEILFIPKHHSNTIYYGYTDALPAIGAMVGNVYIRDYLLQFFEHNTIPRYAVIVKGAKIDDEFRKLITSYFTTHVKGQAHKTLILTLQGMAASKIDIEFKELTSGHKEADFLQTRKENSNLVMVSMGTSPAILGIAESSELGSGKGLSQAEIYKDRIVTPCQRYWADKLNLLFRRGLGCLFAELKFDPMDIRDLRLEMEYAQGLSAMGAASSNEVRSYLGWGEPIEGGDTHFVRIKEGAAVQVKHLPLLPPITTTGSEPEETNDDDDDDDTELENSSDASTQ